MKPDNALLKPTWTAIINKNKTALFSIFQRFQNFWLDFVPRATRKQQQQRRHSQSRAHFLNVQRDKSKRVANYVTLGRMLGGPTGIHQQIRLKKKTCWMCMFKCLKRASPSAPVGSCVCVCLGVVPLRARSDSLFFSISSRPKTTLPSTLQIYHVLHSTQKGGAKRGFFRHCLLSLCLIIPRKQLLGLIATSFPLLWRNQNVYPTT